MNNKIWAQLDVGTIKLNIINNYKNWQADDLVDIAQRRNPKRPFLFVSKVLGRHIPQKPSVIRTVYRDLAEQIPIDVPSPIVIIGMAETAVGLGAGVHQEYTNRQKQDVLFLTTTRHELQHDIFCTFEEEHSHSTKHYIYQPKDLQWRNKLKQAKTIIMVDDEATTGKTFFNLYQALTQVGLDQIENIINVTITDWSVEQQNYQLDIPVTSISLISGNWSWHANEKANELVVPTAKNVAIPQQVLHSFYHLWGRLGVTNHDVSLTSETVNPGEKVLVLGSSEFIWLPFLLAESLEKNGAIVEFGAVSRSPISEGFSIKNSYSFYDNYGINVPMYGYNIFPDNYDRIILCSETVQSSWDERFLSKLAPLEFIV